MKSEKEPQQPVPQGAYVSARRYGELVHTSGMTPRKNGVLVLEGPIRTSEALENYNDAVILAASNALAAAESTLEAGETIASVLNMTVFIAAEADFVSHSALADFASRFLEAKLGPDGIGARAAVGVATLPGNAPVELQLVVTVGMHDKVGK